MAKKKIRTVSYIPIGDKLVCTDDLTPEQKTYVATKLKVKYLNALFAGQAVFEPATPLPPPSDLFPELRESQGAGC